MTDIWTNFHFIRPACLVFIPVAILIWWLCQRRTEPLRGWREQIDPDLLQAIIVGTHSKHDTVAFWRLAAWILAAVAVAGPTWRKEPNPFASDAAPLMILLKANATMDLPDPPPSRMERANLKIADLARLRKGQPMGLIAYAGSSHIVLPPTRDTSIISEMASQICSEIMPTAGDRLDLAIQKASKILRDRDQGGSLLVIADSAEIDPDTVLAAYPPDERIPIQFLPMCDTKSPETKSIVAVANKLGATIQTRSIDDQDVKDAVDFAERRATSGIEGQSRRWRESGFWLTPAVALIVALSFRRRKIVLPESSP